MVYDPQRDQPRRRASEGGPSPVDSLLDGRPGEPETPQSHPAEPAEPTATTGPVTEPRPQGSCSDRLLHSGGFSTLLSAAMALLALGWLLRRCKRRRAG